MTKNELKWKDVIFFVIILIGILYSEEMKKTYRPDFDCSPVSLLPKKSHFSPLESNSSSSGFDYNTKES